MARTPKQTFTDCHGREWPIVPASELNLDAMPGGSNYLGSFWARYQRGCHARELFPEGGKGTRTATADLANYAINKSTAMQCRSRGDIVAAILYEGIADRIYERLPEGARW